MSVYVPPSDKTWVQYTKCDKEQIQDNVKKFRSPEI